MRNEVPRASGPPGSLAEALGAVAAATAALGTVPLTGRVVTGAALLTQRAIGEQIVADGDDYRLPVDENQPTLRAESAAACSPLWASATRDAQGVPIPPRWLADQMAARGGRLTGVLRAEPKGRHGRRELRGCWALADPRLLRWLGSTGAHRRPWPQLRQLVRLERHRLPVRRGIPLGEPEVEVVYWITSVPPARADAGTLLRWQRGHWGIENRRHSVRDTAVAEDRCTSRSGAAPQLLAACRNLALARLRRDGSTTIAAALCSHAARPPRAIRRLSNSVVK